MGAWTSSGIVMKNPGPMMTSSNETFSALLALCGGIHRSPVNSLTKASDAELWYFLWSVPEQTVKFAVETPVIWDAIALIMTSL